MRKSIATKTLHIGLALNLSIALLIIGAIAAEKYHWAFVHSWALIHGTIFVVFPAYFLLSFVFVRWLLRLLHVHESATVDGQPQRISHMAVWSLLLSGTGFLIPIGGCVPAIVLGHLARRRCRTDPHLYGSGIALGGLIMSYAGLAFGFYMLGVMTWAVLKVR